MSLPPEPVEPVELLPVVAPWPPELVPVEVFPPEFVPDEFAPPVVVFPPLWLALGAGEPGGATVWPAEAGAGA
ncbi:hypothetical protein, partial [Streptomyces sp. SID3343]|uniref:hypothetical protein n=1 Tax=Streptomyces sp. SID3343 TaxID=2690260 RepID=UPI0031F944CD